MDTNNREEVKEAFGEDINIVRTGNSFNGSQFGDGDHHLVPRKPDMPANANTGERVMRIAMGMGHRTYENPLQLAIALKGFESWCEQTGWTPNYATIAYYLNISKSTLVKYTDDRTQYMCYSLIDNITGEYIYSSNSKKLLDIYIERNNVVDIEDNESNTDSNISDISNGKCKSIQEKIDNGEYSIVTSNTTFADCLEPINNWMEMINEEQAVHSKNPSWNIFKALNHMGRTTQYSNKQEISIQPTNPIDDLDDSAILRASQSRPDA